MKALIIDDEQKAREILELLVQGFVPSITETRVASGGAQALEILKEYLPDIVFLDIKMPGMNGFEWLQQVKNRDFEVIFTTAYDQYAIQAIRFSAFDYLLKPIDPDDLVKCIDRLNSEVETDRKKKFVNLIHNLQQPGTNTFRLTIATTEGTHFLDPKDIIRCQADGNYTHFYLQKNNRIISSKSLGHYDALLKSHGFIRCHKSHLINRTFVEKLDDQHAFLSDGSSVLVSRRKRPEVRETLSE